MIQSLAQQVATLPARAKTEWLDNLTDEQLEEIGREPWWFMGRPDQQEPVGDWNVWLILAGRGWGKTITGSEWIVDTALKQATYQGAPTQYGIIAETFSDCRKVCIDGPSGLLRTLGRHGLVQDRDYTYNRSSWQIVLATGQRFHLLGADDPDAGRGFNFAGIWADELAKWRYPTQSWVEGILPSLRIGTNPRAVITTTPKPLAILREWVERDDGSVYVTRGSTFDNAANLSATALEELKRRYENTQIGRQELHGDILDYSEGALWTHEMFDRHRAASIPTGIVRRVVGVDPATTNTNQSDETGIIVASIDDDGHLYVEADHSGKYSPEHWGRIVTNLEVDSVVVEVNQGGDMVRQVLESVGCKHPIRKATASRGKQQRAEPVSAMYQQGLVHHVGTFTGLEDQAATWVPGEGKSPDRVDALVWAISGLTRNKAAPVQAINNARPNPWAIH